MKLHNYIIEHTKTSLGCDRYSIKHVWFGFITWPFYETEVISGICNRTWWKTYRRWYAYDKLEHAKQALDRYIKEPYVIYRGYTITRCANCMWLVYSVGEYPRKGRSSYHDWKEYEIGGNLESCKKRIDDMIIRQENDKFKEIIKI